MEHQQLAGDLKSKIEVSGDEDDGQRQEGQNDEEDGHGRSPWRVALEAFYCLKNNIEIQARRMRT